MPQELKIPWPSGRAGSIPAPVPTNKPINTDSVVHLEQARLPRLAEVFAGTKAIDCTGLRCPS
jgi:hypothetical protein